MNKTTNYYTLPSNYADHTRFGGKIYEYDFEGRNSMSDIASRIVSDWKFDEQCRKNIMNRITKGNNVHAKQ